MVKKLAVITLAVIPLLQGGCDRSPQIGDSEAPSRVVRESLYSRIEVEREGTVATMKFNVGRRSWRQSVVDLDDDTRLLLPYSITMLSAALVQPEPQRVLQLGLGGGALNRFLRHAYPLAKMETVELDAEVLAMAKEYMGYNPTENDRVEIEDARTFLKRNSGPWDWILIDAYSGGSVPVHLKTREFYELVRSRLAPGGVAAFNLHATNRLYESDLATLREVFPEVHLFASRNSGNVVAITPENKITSPLNRLENLPDTLPALVYTHLQAVISEYTGLAPESRAQILTDDFAPAEFLQTQPRSSITE